MKDHSGISRRSFLRDVSTFAASIAALRVMPAWSSPLNPKNGLSGAPEGSGTSVMAYVGTYTDHGQGIHIFHVNTASGELAPFKAVKTVNPSWLTLHPTRPLLYAANEETKGGVSAFAIQPDGDLKLINRFDSLGSDPAHISVHSSGKFLLASNFTSGNVVVFPIEADGSLGSATDQKNDLAACTPACEVGPQQPVEGPAGNFPEQLHNGAHAHMIQSDLSGKFVFVSDLGLDRTIVYRFDVDKGTLSDVHTIAASKGAGARHFTLHPNGRWFYSLNEQSSMLAFMHFDPTSGTLSQVMEVSTLPRSFAGTNAGSEIMLSPDSRFLYAGNRLHNTVAIFSVGKDGSPALLGEEWTQGDHPRHFNFDPSGNFFYVCNQRSDDVTAFRVDRKTGKLTFADRYTPVGSPVCIVFRAV